MATQTVPLGLFGNVLRDRIKRDASKAMRACVEVADQLVGIAVQRTDTLKIVDRAEYKRAWRRTVLKDGAQLRNDSPHAPIIEYGRRPGAKMPPLEPILRWMRRKGIIASRRTKFSLRTFVVRRALQRDNEERSTA